jgi:hypothetical protein
VCARPPQPEQTIRTLGFVGTRPQLASVSKMLVFTTCICQYDACVHNLHLSVRCLCSQSACQ